MTCRTEFKQSLPELAGVRHPQHVTEVDEQIDSFRCDVTVSSREAEVPVGDFLLGLDLPSHDVYVITQTS